jgi:hypothetical protein
MAAETRTVEPEGPAVAREQLVNIFPRQPKHVSLAMGMHITIQELLEGSSAFYVIHAEVLYGESRQRIRQNPCRGRVHCSPVSHRTQ